MIVFIIPLNCHVYIVKILYFYWNYSKFHFSLIGYQIYYRFNFFMCLIDYLSDLHAYSFLSTISRLPCGAFQKGRSGSIFSVLSGFAPRSEQGSRHLALDVQHNFSLFETFFLHGIGLGLSWLNIHFFIFPKYIPLNRSVGYLTSTLFFHLLKTSRSKYNLELDIWLPKVESHCR